MPTLPWDRILETCVKRDATDLFLIPGCSPLLRFSDQLFLRALQTPPMDAADIEAMAGELLVPPEKVVHHEGYRYIDFRYGTPPNPSWRFRLTVFGEEKLVMAMIMPLPTQAQTD